MHEPWAAKAERSQAEPCDRADRDDVDAAEADRRRLWGAIQLARTVDTCASILNGRPVRAGNLDGFVLRRALRGGPLPGAETYLRVSPEMLEAVAEAGRLP